MLNNLQPKLICYYTRDLLLVRGLFSTKERSVKYPEHPGNIKQHAHC